MLDMINCAEQYKCKKKRKKSVIKWQMSMVPFSMAGMTKMAEGFAHNVQCKCFCHAGKPTAWSSKTVSIDPSVSYMDNKVLTDI